jgi:hypothetical protein
MSVMGMTIAKGPGLLNCRSGVAMVRASDRGGGEGASGADCFAPLSGNRPVNRGVAFSGAKQPMGQRGAADQHGVLGVEYQALDGILSHGRRSFGLSTIARAE